MSLYYYICLRAKTNEGYQITHNNNIVVALLRSLRLFHCERDILSLSVKLHRGNEIISGLVTMATV